MVTEERDEKLAPSVLKDESQIAIAPALKKLVPQFTDTETAVRVRLTITFDEIAKSQ